jgi:hypothetical protein
MIRIYVHANKGDFKARISNSSELFYDLSRVCVCVCNRVFVSFTSI